VSTPAQLALVDVPVVPSLTPRQQRALEVVQAAGVDGIHADELGAALHAEYRKHALEARCMWCGATGQSILKALKAKGLVRYRRGNRERAGFWIHVDAPQAAVVASPGMLGPDEALPF
jgi:hypothetical protein